MTETNGFDESRGGQMDDDKRVNTKGWWVVGTLLCVGLAVVMIPRLAETTPIELGVSQPPLITIIFDTSGGMQWTEEGEGYFPEWEHGAVSDTDKHLHRWEPGADLNLPGSARRDPSAAGGYRAVDSHHSDRVDAVGPCMVWHPMSSDTGTGSEQCEDYARPPTCGTTSDCEYSDHYTSGMESRLERMRKDTDFRLMRDDNKPRHIQVKEILTGDMYLTDDSGAIVDGPGCWFVPRARTIYANEQICCSEIDGSGCTGSGNEAFGKFIDHRDPVPHFQEVYDGQHPTGLLDRLASTSIFSIAMFDSFADDGVEDGGWQYPMRDIMAGSSPYSNSDVNWVDLHCENEDGYPDCHDMGLFRLAGPTHFRLDDGDLIRVARHVQEAVLDAGFLIAHDHPEQVETLSSNLANEEGEFSNIDVFPYPIGQQPIAEATPFGAAFHDLHQFYEHGQRLAIDGSEAENPIRSDPYFECRSRHTVFFTDGIAEPEAPGGAGAGLGSDRLENQAFGYRKEMFPYLTAERAIREMIQSVTDALPSDTDSRFYPRVHVLGVGVQGASAPDPDNPGAPDVDDGLYAQVLDKLAEMAHAGNTCAQYYLPASMIPEFDNSGAPIETGEYDLNGNPVPGSCDIHGDDVCLVPQDVIVEGSKRSSRPYDPPNSEIDNFACHHPALVLSKADRDALTEAFQLIFNEIAGASGIASRSRPAMTSYLDDDDNIGQYRFYSGLEAGGDNPHYRGLLHRQLLACNFEDDDVDLDLDSDPVAIHDEMMRLRLPLPIEEGDLEEAHRKKSEGDRRRVFTSVPKFLIRYVDDDYSGNEMALGEDNSADKEPNFFNTTYQLISAGGQSDDQFGKFDISGVSTFYQADTRIPFDHSSLEDTFEAELNLTDSAFQDAFYDYWNVGEDFTGTGSRAATFQEMIDDYRGRTAYRSDRVLGAIYNSTPVAVGPPNLDLPIDSYREFRRNYAERPTMIYVTTVDGQLRAIHSGQPKVMVKQELEVGYTDDGSSQESSATEDQREAWAYIPQLLHRNLAASSGGTSTDGLMDGSPVVRDVRLCQRGEAFSTNPRVCPNSTTASEWRTVLVQGMGLAGSGYFAIDITRSGAKDDRESPRMPDPIPMWEFGPDWEGLQIQEMSEWRYRTPGADYADEMDDNECTERLDNILSSLTGGLLGGDDAPEDIWELPFLGTTVGEPAMGTVNMTANETRIQRPVVVVGAGTSAGANPRMPFSGQDLSACADTITGRAIYVIDLQSGEMLRRFVDYSVDGPGRARFSAGITGTPVLSGSNPADVSTRGFVGDEEGKMFRVDLSDPDPANWDVELFFDPAEDSDVIGTLEPGQKLGPAAFRPAVARGMNRELVLIYGLGHQGDLGADDDTVQAVIALEEEWQSLGEGFRAKPLWREILDGGERLTGAPLVFDSDVYFTTYVEQDDQCQPGTSRIYRLAYDGVDPMDTSPQECCESVGRWDREVLGESLAASDILIHGEDPAKWFGPRDPTMIRGMAITMGPTCQLDGGEDLGSTEPPRRPQLVAQTGGASVDDGTDVGGTGGGGRDIGGIGTISVNLEAPRTRSIPMSWSVIEN